MKQSSKIKFVIACFVIVVLIIGIAIGLNRYFSASADNATLPTSTTTTLTQTQTYGAKIVAFSYNAKDIVLYKYDSGEWWGGGDTSNWVKVTDDAKMAEEYKSLDPSTAYEYKTITNGLKDNHQDQAAGMRILLARFKDAAVNNLVDATFTLSDGSYVSVSTINKNPGAYSISSDGKLTIDAGAPAPTNSTGVTSSASPTRLVGSANSGSEGGSSGTDGTTSIGGGGGSISLPGGITINQPSALSKFTSFDNAYEGIFSIVVGVAGAIFIAMLLYGGIMYLTSMGVEEQSVKARKILLDAVIGIGIVALSWTVGSWVIGQLQNAGFLK